jgi:hypothetical protein
MNLDTMASIDDPTVVADDDDFNLAEYEEAPISTFAPPLSE